MVIYLATTANHGTQGIATLHRCTYTPHPRGDSGLTRVSFKMKHKVNTQGDAYGGTHSATGDTRWDVGETFKATQVTLDATWVTRNVAQVTDDAKWGTFTVPLDARLVTISATLGTIQGDTR